MRRTLQSDVGRSMRLSNARRYCQEHDGNKEISANTVPALERLEMKNKRLRKDKKTGESSPRMRCGVVLALLLASLSLSQSAFSQSRYYLPQITNGNYGTGSYRTTFILFNNANTPATATLELTDDEGNPLAVTTDGKTESHFVIPLPAGGSKTIQTDGQGNLVTGAARVTATAAIGVSAIFTVYDARGTFMTETGVGHSEPLSSFVLPVDTTGFFNTGLALFNVNDDSVTVTMTLRNGAGRIVGPPAMILLKPHNHLAKFIYGPEELFPAMVNFQGTLLVESSAPISSVALRQNLSPISFTSLPSFSTASPGRKLNLAQVANGSFGSGTCRTSFLVFNITGTPANVSLTLTADSGAPLIMRIRGWGTGSDFAFPNLAPGAALFLQTDGTGDLVTGAATISADVPIGASGILTVLDSQGGFRTEAGIGTSPVLSSMTLPVDITGPSDTGIAFQAGGTGSELTFQLADTAGAPAFSSLKRKVAANGHLAAFVSELFPGTGDFRGSLSVTSTAGVAALTLRQNSSPLTFTTLPVISGTALTPGGEMTLAQTISDQAQRTTLAFSGLAMMTGNLEAQSFFPPGKVADYTGFQYLRDNDPDNMGHNTSFLTRVANNVIYVLSDSQFAQLKTLATTQLDQINLYGFMRFPLMKAFRRLLDGNIPSGSAGLNLNAVKAASRELYLLDGQISFDRAKLYAGLILSLTSTQKAYLDAMKGMGWSSWPDITDTQIRSKMQGLPQGTAVAVMTYASDLFSWYAGSVDADVYFCPERQGTYYGSFYMKDAPAIGHEGYGINEQLTATAGAALSDSSKGYVTADQAAAISSLVDKQRNNLYASPTSNIVAVRTEIATLLRSLLTAATSAESVQAQVLSLSATYGELDGENNYYYATVFAQVYKSLTADQKLRLAGLRRSIMSGTYSDGTAFDFTTCTTPFLYSSAITDTSRLAPYLNNTDYLFFEP